MAELNRLPWSKPEFPAGPAAGGVASPGDIMGASFDQMWFVENTTAANDSLVEAYERLRQDIRTATGADLGNPMITLPEPSFVPNPIETIGRQYGQGDVIAQQRLQFQQKLNELAAQYPREAVKDWAQRDPVQDAQRIAREADERLGQMMESRPGWDGTIYQFAGAAGAAMRDPLTIGSLFLGGGPGGARTVLGRVLQTAGREAAINAGTEAAMQPWVQSWREQAGLDHGFDQAISNIAFAAGLGGLFGLGAGGVREAVQFAQLTPEQRQRLAPELRGAVDAGNALGVIEAQRLPDIAPAIHETRLAQAEAAARHEPLAVPVALDELQVSRILESLAPERAAPAEPASSYAATLAAIRAGEPLASVSAAQRPVMDFVRSIGGVDPQSPIAQELRAIGITNRDMPGLFKTGGHTDLDNIPASEAQRAFPGRTDIEDGNGYVSRQAFLDAMEAEQTRARAETPGLDAERADWERRGVDFSNPDDDAVLARMAQVSEAEARWAEAGAEARLEADSLIRQALEIAGGTAPDAVVRAAVDLVREGESIRTAMEWALSDAAGINRAMPAAADEFQALGTRPPDPAEDFPPEWAADWDADVTALEEWAAAEGLADLGLPFGDDLVSPEQLRSIVEDAETLERVVAACPF